MIKNIKALASYLELPDAQEETLGEWVARKVPSAWARLGGYEHIPTKPRIQIADALGRVQSDGIVWYAITLNQSPLRVIPDAVLEGLSASIIGEEVRSPLSYEETLKKILLSPTSRYNVMLCPGGGYRVVFKVETIGFRLSGGYIALGFEGEGSKFSIYFPFSEQDWDDTIKKLRFS